jgi:hypothetical protein
MTTDVPAHVLMVLCGRAFVGLTEYIDMMDPAVVALDYCQRRIPSGSCPRWHRRLNKWSVFVYLVWIYPTSPVVYCYSC